MTSPFPPVVVERHSRPPFARMQTIDARLQENRFPNCTTLAGELEVTPRTVLRDIEHMRSREGRPIDYDAVRRGYYYTQPIAPLARVVMTEGEMVALLVAQKALEPYRGTPYEAALTVAFQKLTASLPDKISFPLLAHEGGVAFKPLGVSTLDLATFETISRAVLAEQELRFDYRKHTGLAREPRHVQPLQLACIQHAWYLAAHDLDRGALRTFALTRVTAPVMTPRTFRPPATFNPSTHFAGGFGVFTGEGQHTVRIRFDAWAAELVHERTWHASQTFDALPDGGTELTLRLSNLLEIEGWILSWGAHAEVLAPEELRGRVQRTIATLAHRYGPPPA